jgi:peptidoglycan/LPS O-acetylase OafA/YrhL
LILTISGGLAVATASDLVPDGGNPVWRSIALYAFFFLLGARLPEVWMAVASRSNVLLLVAALATVPSSVAVFGLLPNIAQGAGRVTLSVVCVGAAIIVAAMVARVGRLAAPFRYVGQRTIAVYVVHAMLLAAVVPLIPVGILPPVVVAIVLTAFGVAVPLLLYRALAPVGGVFNLPHPVARRLSAVADR